MREIKFRAWDKSASLMAMDIQDEYDTIHDVRYYKNGSVVKDENGHEEYPGENCFGDYLNNKNYVVMQFTGLKDKNGKEIYEGDIVLCGDDGEYFGQRYDEEKDEYIDTDHFVVEWVDSDTYVAFDLKDNPCEETNGISHALSTGYMEVIGNIYENPELMEKIK